MRSGTNYICAFVCVCVRIPVCLCVAVLWGKKVTLRKTSVSLTPMQFLAPLPKEQRKCSWPAFLHIYKDLQGWTYTQNVKKSKNQYSDECWTSRQLLKKYCVQIRAFKALIEDSLRTVFKFHSMFVLCRIMTNSCPCFLQNCQRRHCYPHQMWRHDGQTSQPIIGSKWWPVVNDHKSKLCSSLINAAL